MGLLDERDLASWYFGRSIMGCGSDSADQSLDAVFQKNLIEVDEEAKSFSGKFEVGKQLRLEQSDQPLDGFDLNDHAICDYKIQPKSCVKSDVLINDGKRNLPLEFDTASRQLVTETNFIDGFQETRSQISMYLQCGVNDLSRDAIGFRRDRFEFVGHSFLAIAEFGAT